MGILLFFIATVLIYIILSLFVGIIGGFGVWDFTLLKDLIIFWTVPKAETGAFWKCFILFVSMAGSASLALEFFGGLDNYNYPLPPKITPEDFTISEPNQCVVKKDEHVDISV